MSKITLQGYIILADSDLKVVTDELIIHKKLTLEEAGCLTFSVEQDTHNIHKFHVYEEFVNQAAFDKHQLRVKSSHWGNVTKNVERHYQIK